MDIEKKRRGDAARRGAKKAARTRKKNDAARDAMKATDRELAARTLRVPVEGRQLMVPGVAPAAPREDDHARTVATLVLTRGLMRKHRVAVALSGMTTWQEWALRHLNAAAGVSS